MQIINETLSLKTTKRCDMIDISSQVAKSVKTAGIVAGIVMVYCPHTTGAITINENADPSVVDDMLMTLDQLIPEGRTGYRHMEGNSDAHVKSSMFGCSETIMIANSKMILGTWQGIYFCEFGGPRNRRIHIQIRGQ